MIVFVLGSPELGIMQIFIYIKLYFVCLLQYQLFMC